MDIWHGIECILAIFRHMWSWWMDIALCLNVDICGYSCENSFEISGDIWEYYIHLMVSYKCYQWFYWDLIAGFVVLRCGFEWVSGLVWELGRAYLLVLIRVVKGFVPKLSKGEIVNVIVRLAILDKIPKCLLAMVL